MYGKIVFNNVKEFTPSWIKTVQYSQCAKPTLTTGTQRISKWVACPRTKAFIRMFQENVCARPAIWQAYIFVSKPPFYSNRRLRDDLRDLLPLEMGVLCQQPREVSGTRPEQGETVQTEPGRGRGRGVTVTANTFIIP